MLFMFMKEKKANKRYNHTTFDFIKIQLIMNGLLVISINGYLWLNQHCYCNK